MKNIIYIIGFVLVVAAFVIFVVGGSSYTDPYAQDRSDLAAARGGGGARPSGARPSGARPSAPSRPVARPSGGRGRPAPPVYRPPVVAPYQPPTVGGGGGGPAGDYPPPPPPPGPMGPDEQGPPPGPDDQGPPPTDDDQGPPPEAMYYY